MQNNSTFAAATVSDNTLPHLQKPRKKPVLRETAASLARRANQQTPDHRQAVAYAMLRTG